MVKISAFWNGIRLSVLGTTFNFKSDKNCRVAEATLIEGEIEVKGNKEEGQIILGSQYTYTHSVALYGKWFMTVLCYLKIGFSFQIDITSNTD